MGAGAACVAFHSREEGLAGLSSIGSSSCLRLGRRTTGGCSSSSPSCQILLGGGGSCCVTSEGGCSSGRSNRFMIFLMRRATGLSGTAVSAGSGVGGGEGGTGSREERSPCTSTSGIGSNNSNRVFIADISMY